MILQRNLHQSENCDKQIAQNELHPHSGDVIEQIFSQTT